MKKRFNGMDTVEAFQMMQLISMMPPPSPAHLAALPPIPSNRLSDFVDSYHYSKTYDEDWWPNQQIAEPTQQSDICDKHGHWMEMSCDAENGHEAGSCILCGWGFSCYM